MTDRTRTGVFLTSSDPTAISPIALVADAPLPAAALTALLLLDGSRRVVRVVHGVNELDAEMAAMAPAIVIQEWGTHSKPVEGHGARPYLVLLDPADEPDVLNRAVRSGARGYLSRTASPRRLETAMRSTASAGHYVDPLLVSRLLGAHRQAGTGLLPLGSRRPLSRREQQILLGVARGRSSKELAKEHAITPKTVCNHVNSIYAKLRLRHRGQLVLYAARQGWTLG